MDFNTISKYFDTSYLPSTLTENFQLVKDVTYSNKIKTICIVSGVVVVYVYVKHCRSNDNNETIGYILKDPLTSNEPYHGYEHPPIIMDNPILKTRFSIWFLRFLLKSPLRNILVGGMIRQAGFHLLNNYVLPEKPTFKPYVQGSKDLYEKDMITDDDLWKLIESSDDSDDTGFQFTSISSIINGYRAEKFTPIEVVNKVISALKEMDTQQMKAIIEYNEPLIIKAALESSERWKNGKPLSVFDGVPVAFKDQYFVDGHHCRNGTPSILFDEIKTLADEGGMIKRLREGGAILIGVTNLHQCGISVFGINPSRYHGTSLNPYDTDFSAGGSSGGSAAAIAAGLCPIALGTDAGGSIRSPAGACGVVGLKATFDRFPVEGGMINSTTVGHTGPLCSSVRDAAIAYGYLADRQPKEMKIPPVALKKFGDDKHNKLKIGVDWDWINCAEEEIKEKMFEALKLIEQELDVQIVNIHFPEKEESYRGYICTTLNEFAFNNEMLRNQSEEELNLDTLMTFMVGEDLTCSHYLQAAKQRTRCINAFKYLFTKVDVICLPGFSMFQPKLDDSMKKYGYVDAKRVSEVVKLSALGNYTGVPALTLPIGYASNNLPISLQVIAPWWREDLLLGASLQIEQLFKKKRPSCYFDITKNDTKA